VEEFLYEARPYFYALIAIGVLLYYQGSNIGIFSGVLLICAAGIIIKLRHNYRKSHRENPLPKSKNKFKK
jgi:hypothetical protein